MNIEEMIGSDAFGRLREQFGCLVDYISVETEVDIGLNQKIVKLKFGVTALKRDIYPPPDSERGIGMGVAEIRTALYRSLEIGESGMKYMDEPHICVDNVLSPDVVLMNHAVYTKLRGYDHELLREIGRILDRT